jgi:hypothetical protein
MMHVETLGIEHPGWLRSLQQLPHDLYHRPEYVYLEAQRQEAIAEAFIARDGEQLFFVPYLLRACDILFPKESTGAWDVISPYGYPGILLSDAARDPFALEAIAALCDGLGRRGVCSAFMRMHPILCRDLRALFPAGTCSDLSETVAIDLTLDETTLWNQIRKGHRETIRKGHQNGFVARFVPLAEVLDEFIVVYEQTMNRVKAKKMYYFGRCYFAELAKIRNVHCCVIESDAAIAAACLFFETDGIVQAHLGGTRTEFIQMSPFHMTLYHGSLWGKRRGNRWLHLGGGLRDSDDKLLSFKRGFSPHRFQLQSVRIILDDSVYRRLVDLRADSLNRLPEALLSSTFFPAYRLAT